jgi:hypothetical protein
MDLYREFVGSLDGAGAQAVLADTARRVYRLAAPDTAT